MIYYILLGRILQLPRGKGHKRTSRSYSKVPHLTPPPHSHTKDSHSTGITLLFSNSAWVLLRPTELSTFKELWDGTSDLSSLSEKTRKSNHLQMKLQRQHFLLSYLKTLSVDPVLLFPTRRRKKSHTQNSVVMRVVNIFRAKRHQSSMYLLWLLYFKSSKSIITELL